MGVEFPILKTKTRENHRRVRSEDTLPPRFFQKLTWIAEGLAAWGLYWLFRWLPLTWCSGVGARIRRYQGGERVRIQQRVLDNLQWLMPKLGDAERNRLTQALLIGVGRSYFEVMVVDRLIHEGKVDVVPPAFAEPILREGRPLILVTVHLANLGDLIIASLADVLFRHYGYEVGGTPTRPIPNPWLARLSGRIRNRYLSGINFRGFHPSLKTARDFFRFLAKPKSVVMFHVDEAYDRQVHFPAFGRALDVRGNLFKAIKLSASTGALIVPVVLRRTGADLRYQVEWLPAIEVRATGARLSDDDLLKYAHQLNQLFEPKVMENLVDWAQVCYLRVPPNSPTFSTSARTRCDEAKARAG